MRRLHHKAGEPPPDNRQGQLLDGSEWMVLVWETLGSGGEWGKVENKACLQSRSPLSPPKGALQEFGRSAAHTPVFHEKLEACSFIWSFILYIMATSVHFERYVEVMVTDANSPLNFPPQGTLQGNAARLSCGFQLSLKSNVPCGENQGEHGPGEGTSILVWESEVWARLFQSNLPFIMLTLHHQKCEIVTENRVCTK